MGDELNLQANGNSLKLTIIHFQQTDNVDDMLLSLLGGMGRGIMASPNQLCNKKFVYQRRDSP